MVAGRTRSSIPSGDKQPKMRPFINENTESADSMDDKPDEKMEVIS
jgi:hypothetical protein